MAKIILKGSGEPTNPEAGQYVWWIDSSTGVMKYKDSAGAITEVTSGTDGATGATGADGADGIDGVNGIDGINGVDGDSMFEETVPASVTVDNPVTISQKVSTEVLVPSLFQIGDDTTDTTGWGADQIGRMRVRITYNANGLVNTLSMWSMGSNGSTSSYGWHTVYTGQDNQPPTE